MSVKCACCIAERAGQVFNPNPTAEVTGAQAAATWFSGYLEHKGRRAEGASLEGLSAMVDAEGTLACHTSMLWRSNSVAL